MQHDFRKTFILAGLTWALIMVSIMICLTPRVKIAYRVLLGQPVCYRINFVDGEIVTIGQVEGVITVTECEFIKTQKGVYTSPIHGVKLDPFTNDIAQTHRIVTKREAKFVILKRLIKERHLDFRKLVENGDGWYVNEYGSIVRKK